MDLLKLIYKMSETIIFYYLFKLLIMSKSDKYFMLEDDISSTQSSEGEDYIPKRIISKSNTRRIHKIPIEQQQ